MNKYNFIDYSIKNIFNEVFAIEPEISREYYHNIFSAEHSCEYHNESSTITELINLHLKTPEKKLAMYNHVYEFYKDKFPIWSDRRLSWGVHMHIFKWNYKWLDAKKLKFNLLNLPLFTKIKSRKMYWRYFSNRSNFKETISNNDKSWAVSYKNSYHSHNREWARFTNESIEFRCNNVFDARIYWYYIWIMIANKEWTKFKKTSDSMRRFIQRWITQQYHDWHDMELKNIIWYRISEEDFIVLQHNTKVLLKLLQINWLIECAKALLEYVNECWLEIDMDISLRDSFTLEPVSNPIFIPNITLFRIKYIWLYFNTEENYYAYIKGLMKKKLLIAWIPQALITINEEAIIKKYKKHLPDKVNMDKQETLFD